ncbi:MAG: hypothetical protein UY74_C0045G0011 [Candidatus Kaiserbacteria bacterium GW2011_GWC2_52_8b]|uniref:Major facilitator superfamily n=1 Tax=Candidatus Kaiserbacteria bacterium GW2011_GWC2_52_8b TaxID=1618676 RepID=A0A0G1XHA7_9BACT|nr:MAG: hypothetical protein UY74_C0045G0011 [Candidatus Kaiserbacteria bacterium GW2011_GWC2_52_8b]
MIISSALSLHRFFVRTGLMVGVFAWIFIFQYALAGTALTYALMHDVTLLLTPLSARSLRNGSRRPLMIGILLASIAFAALALAFSGSAGAQIGLGVLAFALCMGSYRACYWVPYEVDASRVAHPKHRHLVQELFFAFVPACVGLVLMLGYPAPVWVLFLAALCVLSSIIPLLRVPNVHEGFSWGYLTTFRELFAARHQKMVVAAIMDGVSGAALLLFWPIAIFLIVGWSYALVGIILSATFLIVLFSRRYIRRLIQSSSLHDSVVVQAALAASSWIFRLTVASPLGAVMVDSYFYTGTPIRGTGIDPFGYDQAADRGSYVDEYTALKEIGLSIGKILVCLVAAYLALRISLPLTLMSIFALAALASSISVFLTWKKDALPY